ncbi:hypothetical protein MLD38_009916 [Melastoma candidum]|uniref:Uncharacterized protein n=1 Tax=Melastoma candidum TaxID=119954 RepID=A0ACB9R6G9_9MYRT|nr:hypothetical protein MLD38_009916 [Melastoma candidum]
MMWTTGKKKDSRGDINGRARQGFLCNCSTNLKLLLTALLVICILVNLLQYLHPRILNFYPDYLHYCISHASSSPPPPPPSMLPAEIVVEPGIIRRAFRTYGWAAYNYIIIGAYRGGPSTFAVVGLSSKTLHLHSNASYICQWLPSNSTSSSTPIFSQDQAKIFPDWKLGLIYSVVVVNCTFSHPVNADNSGGKLLLHAFTSGGGDLNLNLTDTIEALEELPGGVDFSVFTSEPKYEYFYCGSPLFGNLSPQRVREWIAYHVRLFGTKSHFVLYDAGGVHPEVLEVLRPWMELGYFTIHNIRGEERFAGHYHNQFLVLNDCLHRYKFATQWMFFFDVDEFIYVPPNSTLKSVLHSLLRYTQFTMEQLPMSDQICSSNDLNATYRKWGFEKLVYRDVKRQLRRTRDRKYAVQPRGVRANGIHLSEHVNGKSTDLEDQLKYFHYHGTVAERQEPCRILTNSTELTVKSNLYVLDDRMVKAGDAVKRFERKTIGDRLLKTQQ